jgi:hypothetical protein
MVGEGGRGGRAMRERGREEEADWNFNNRSSSSGRRRGRRSDGT